MSIGSPVVFDAAPKNRQFSRLIATSTRRDDPNFFEEKLLQQLICETPDVLPVREFLPSTSALFHLGREVPVDIGDKEGYIDNLLVTNDGYVVIVETKLYRNPEAIREVVAQTLQYGTAMWQMPILELETRIRRGENPSLQRDESIRDCVSRLAIANQVPSAFLADDFEDTLDRHWRRGEVLLLVASDSIRIGVGRVTHWLNEQGSSSPFRFGLVELRFYAFGNQRLVVPRAVLKTQEVSRYVVAVDIQPIPEVNVSAKVTDDFQSATGGKRQESRPVKAASAPLTKGTLLQLLRPEDRDAASRLIEQLEILQFEPKGTVSTLKFGFTSSDGEFHSLVALDKSGVWVGPLKKDADRLGLEAVLDFRKGVNQFAPFYKSEQLSHLIGFGCAGKYQQVEQSAADFAAFLDVFRTKIAAELEQQEE